MINKIDGLFWVINTTSFQEDFGHCGGYPLLCGQTCFCMCQETLSVSELQTLDVRVLNEYQTRHFGTDPSMKLFCQMVSGKPNPNSELTRIVVKQPQKYKFMAEQMEGTWIIDATKIGIKGALRESDLGEKKRQVTLYEFRELFMKAMLVFQTNLLDKMVTAYEIEQKKVEVLSGNTESAGLSTDTSGLHKMQSSI